jgi:hypothetical protein
MAKTNKKTATKRSAKHELDQEYDGVYLLKLVLYVLLGSMWIKLSHGQHMNIPLPVGFIIGIVFSSHEHFRIDRKIEYAVLLVAMLVGYFAPFGLYLSF